MRLLTTLPRNILGYFKLKVFSFDKVERGRGKEYPCLISTFKLFTYELSYFSKVQHKQDFYFTEPWNHRSVFSMNFQHADVNANTCSESLSILALLCLSQTCQDNYAGAEKLLISVKCCVITTALYSRFSPFCWELDVSWTASYEITLVHLSVCPSLSFLKIG